MPRTELAVHPLLQGCISENSSGSRSLPARWVSETARLGRATHWVLGVAIVLALFGHLLGAVPAQSLASDFKALREQVKKTHLDTSNAVSASGLKLRAGPAQISLRSGILVPATPVGGEVRELVFLGEGLVELAAANSIEAQQLELFTGAEAVEEEISSAVLVVAKNPALRELLRREPPSAVAPSELAEAQALFSAWQTSGERRLLQVESVVLADALHDRFAASYFAGWFESEDLGKFLYVFDPGAYEQVLMGQFVALERSDKEKRKLTRRIAKEQRQGRFLGLELGDLGQWDTWTSAALARNGEVHHGGSPVDVLHYSIHLSVEPRTLVLQAVARIELRSLASGARLLPFALQRDLRVESVRAGSADDVPFLQQGDQLSVYLPEGTKAGEQHSLEISYRGVLVEEVERARVLTTTMGWYPRGDETDQATFDVTLRWPDRLDLLGCGQVVDKGRSGGQRWERRKTTRPVLGFTFEIGRFETLETNAGHIKVTVGFDPTSASVIKPDTRQELLNTLRDALLYYQEVIGPYPFDSLVAVSSPRWFSQSLPGFITLSTAMVADDVWLRLMRGSDARATVAHEVAHQWWGHLIGWEGYRDQWLSEALAEWSALAFARNRLKSRAAGPLRGWKSSLLALSEDGRPVESLGPVVLGARLDSSRSPGAYSAIVYSKGAVVIDMLAKQFGEETFLRILTSLIKGLGGRKLSTKDFFDAIERISDHDLTSFTRQYVYGTGIPQVYYDYSILKTQQGWRIEGEATQVPSYRLDYKIVELGRGYSLARERIDLIDTEDSRMVVPVQVSVLDPSQSLRDGQPERGNVVMVTTLHLKGPTTPIELDLALEPKHVWLDGLSEVLGRFVNNKRDPKKVLYYQGLQFAASGQTAEAEAKFRQALRVESMPGPTLQGEPISEKAARLDGLGTDSDINYSLCRLYLDAGRIDAAERALELGNDLDRRYDKLSLGIPGRPAFADVLEARIALRRGAAEQAFQLLNRVVRKRRRISNRESLMALAIAAKATKRSEVLAEALDLAEKMGGDVSVLR